MLCIHMFQHINYDLQQFLSEAVILVDYELSWPWPVLWGRRVVCIADSGIINNSSFSFICTLMISISSLYTGCQRSGS